MINLQQGDYVYVRDLSDEQIEALVNCFVAAGASDYDEGAHRQDEWPWLLWDDGNDVWCTLDTAKRRQGRRELTVEQVLGTACKPEAPEWDGEGLPPVGVECECWHTGCHQGVVTVRYMGSEMCVLLNHGHGKEQCGPIESYEFRPIRSEEERALDQIMDDCGVARCVARTIYEAGYRKVDKP